MEITSMIHKTFIYFPHNMRYHIQRTNFVECLLGILGGSFTLKLDILVIIFMVAKDMHMEEEYHIQLVEDYKSVLEVFVWVVAL